MTRDASALAASVQEATAPEFRGRLLARGQAQSMIRRDGILPEDAPQFGANLDDDLLSYGYALIATSLQLLEAVDPENSDGGPTAPERQQQAQTGFIEASYALEAATRNAKPDEGMAFHRLIAGAASHLAGYAARAFSLMQTSIDSGRLTPMEHTLADLVLRNLTRIEARTIALRLSAELTDGALLGALTQSSDDPTADDVEKPETTTTSEATTSSDASAVGPIALLLSEHYLSAVSSALFALAYNQTSQLQAALADLATGEQASQEIGVPGPWWVYRLTRRLLGDLGQTSIRTNIPVPRPPAATASDGTTGTGESDWNYLRITFVSMLFARGRSEIDLWPSQLHVVRRIFEDTKDLVVALPTSAGKTRIAELCILACLAQGRRVVYVTPLRALSAQTERVLERTFTPLGAEVSTLYGSIGVNDVDEDALRSSQIVVATPEKLDFALRSDRTVLDDVGLVVLDEGHMIGPSDREVRYEAQVQRLLRRADADTRRIVCLSAVFPSGPDLDDFVAWVTDDEPDGLHRENWRPTRQRFGLVEWFTDHARLAMTFEQEQSFIPRYIEAKAPTGGKRRNPFPHNNRELVIATAWRLVEEGQTVLIFCPQRNSVEPYAREILKLRAQGFIDSVLPSEVDLDEALAIGAEWFGADHPILRCLRVGVAIHHGALPGPFRREVERLLHRGVIKVTVASPTLAQGLNLSASVVLFHGIRRGRALLTGSEFANVIGRAGRAFVDTEGLVLYPRYEPTPRHRREWFDLTVGDAGKALRSGLITVAESLVRRMHAAAGSPKLQAFIDYLTGGVDWAFPVVIGEDTEVRDAAEQTWSSSLALLDTALLSIAGEDESDPDEVTQLIADALRDSLWERQLNRLENQQAANAIRELVSSRARFVWSNSTAAQRRGWYLAGLGAASGYELGLAAARVVELIFHAETAIDNNDTAAAVGSILEIATILFAVSEFKPETSLKWQPVLVHWLSGAPLGLLREDPVEVAQFIEADVVYRLVWGMEAARVYETAHGNIVATVLTGAALTAIETGTFNRSASVLIRSGFDHRAAAIAAVTDSEATFSSSSEMREWIRGLDPDLTESPDWPTVESHAAWLQFTNRADRLRANSWALHVERVEEVAWRGAVPEPRAWLRVTNSGPGRITLWSTGFDALGEALVDINPHRQGVLHARRLSDSSGIELRYRGPRDLHAPDPSR